MKVAILGAGPCGLTAAWELCKKGISVVVIEKDSSVGGLCKTNRENGYQFDLGGHRFISKDTKLVNDIKDLMGDRLLTSKRKSVIKFRDSEYDYPLNMKNVISEASFRQSLRFLVGYLKSSIFGKFNNNSNNSFDSWITKNFGRELNDYFFKPYTEKLWGMPAEKLSDDWAAQRISKINLKDVCLKLLNFSKKDVRSFAINYLYPKGGIGEMFEMMAEDIKKMGGEIICNSTVTGITKDEKNIKCVLLKKDDKEDVFISADYFLSTIPLDYTANLIEPTGLPDLKYRSLRFLNIKLDMKNLSHNTWMYVPESDFIMTRIQEPKRRSPYSSPNGKTSVMLEIPCNIGDEIWTMDDELLLERVVSDLKELGFDIKGKILGYFSTYEEHSYPCYDLDYKEKIKKMKVVIDSFFNFETLGRQGLFRYIFMDTAMLMGRKWAELFFENTDKDINISKKIEELDSEPVLLEAQSVA